ncbi:MAG: MAE_28990/MAE_18760 family HEPN-like nuclease [Coleofasciculaceae cyanobacterium]
MVNEEQPKFNEEQIAAAEKQIVEQSKRIEFYITEYTIEILALKRCLDAVSKSVINRSTHPSHLSDCLRREWVRFIARTHTELNYENRLESTLKLCDHLVQKLPISNFEVEKGAGGSWDDNAITKISTRLGFSLKISPDVYQGVKRPFRNDKGALEFIKQLRNELAHGSLSFAECGEGVTVSDLRQLTERASLYLREVVACFKSSIDAYQFLMPEQRPKRVKEGTKP